MIRYTVECYWTRNGYRSYKTHKGIRFQLAHRSEEIGIQKNSSQKCWDPDIQNAFLFHTKKYAEEARAYIATGTRVISVVLIGNKVWYDPTENLFEQLNIRQLTSILNQYPVASCVAAIKPKVIKNWFVRQVWKFFSLFL